VSVLSPRKSNFTYPRAADLHSAVKKMEDMRLESLWASFEIVSPPELNKTFLMSPASALFENSAFELAIQPSLLTSQDTISDKSSLCAVYAKIDHFFSMDAQLAESSEENEKLRKICDLFSRRLEMKDEIIYSLKKRIKELSQQHQKKNFVFRRF